MKYSSIPGVTKPVSRLAQGSIMLSRGNIDATLALLDAMFENGITILDTAHCYGEDNERIPGEWCASRGVREKFVMLGKCAHPDADGSRCHPAAITEELEMSLDRMGFDYIDLYVMHRDDPSVPVEEIVDCFSEHVDAGRVHAYGGSNWTLERVQAANAYAASAGRTPFAVSSPNFSLAVAAKPMWADCLALQNPDQAAAREWYRETDMALVTWSSVARGFFSGRFRTAEEEAEGNILEGYARESYATPENYERLDRAYQLAEEKGVSVPQIALAYVLNYPLNIFALVGACTPDEVKSNADAVDLELTGEELTWLETGARS